MVNLPYRQNLLLSYKMLIKLDHNIGCLRPSNLFSSTLINNRVMKSDYLLTYMNLMPRLLEPGGSMYIHKLDYSIGCLCFVNVQAIC